MNKFKIRSGLLLATELIAARK